MNTHKVAKYMFAGVILFLPLISFAQFDGTGKLITAGQGIVDNLITIVFAIGLLVFLWGMVKYLANAGDATKAREGRSIMTYGIIAMFVMASIWGIVRFIGGELNIDVGGGGSSDCGSGGIPGEDLFGNPC